MAGIPGTTHTSFDRFEFSIDLSHFMQKRVENQLLNRTLSMAVRYHVPGHGEWWDNCDGRNWNIRFQAVKLHRERRQSDPLCATSSERPRVVPSVSRSTAAKWSLNWKQDQPMDTPWLNPKKSPNRTQGWNTLQASPLAAVGSSRPGCSEVLKVSEEIYQDYLRRQ